MAWERRDTTAAAAIAGLALALRAVQASTVQVIGGDSPAFLMGAQEILAGDWSTGLRNGIHSGYPLAIAGFGKLLGNLEAGAYAASVLFSSLAIIPFYALVRDMMGRRVAIVAALLFACLPAFILEHADIMTEGIFHFFFVTSVAGSWFGATRASWKGYLLAAATSALSYWVRPEGVYTAVAMIGITILELLDARRRGEQPRWRIAGMAAVGAALTVALALPQLALFRSAIGEWKLTQRGSAQLATEALRGGGKDWGGALSRYAHRMLRTSAWLVLPALAGFFFVRRRVRLLAVVYLLCLTAGYSAAPILAASKGYPVSPRYVLVPVLFLMPFAALACVCAAEAAARRWEPRRVRAAAAGLLGAVLLVLMILAIHPRIEPEIGIKEGGLWLRTQAGDHAVVYTNTNKVWWYLGRRVPPLPEKLETIRGGDYVFIHERKLNPGALQSLKARFRPIASFPTGGDPRADRVSVFVR